MTTKAVFLILISVTLLCGCGSPQEDTTPPVLTAASPASNATGVPLSSTVTVIFSEPMSASSLTNANFKVSTGGSDTSGYVSYFGTYAEFIPSSYLAPNTSYAVTVTTGVKDSNGNPLTVNYAWSFTTGTKTTATVSLVTDIQPIFDNSCTSCHTAGGTALFLPLTHGTTSRGSVFGEVYVNLVNQPSTRTTAGALLVKPGDYASSVLYQRVSGIGLPSGKSLMPLNGATLTPVNQDLIKIWIDEGALNN